MKTELDLSPQGKEAVATARIILYDKKFLPIFAKVLTASTGLAPTTAMLTFMLLHKLDDRGLQLDPEEVYKDKGVAEAIAAYIFGFAKSMNIPEADDQQVYFKALDIIDQMADETSNQAEGGGEGQPEPAMDGAPPDQPQGPPQPAAPPGQPAGPPRGLMA